jgi:hypothetical protein
MRRWKHAGLGPRCALIAGVLLGVASLVLYQSAYAAEPPYPGTPALPGIPNGPTLGCNNPNSTNQTWVCGFNPLSTITFLVDGRFAGTAESYSTGCVFVVVTFLNGEVQVDGNAPVPVKAGKNYLTVEGHVTKKAGTELVGRRLPFRTPTGSGSLCVVSPITPPTSTSFSTFPPHSTTTSSPIETTMHGFYPTTLAKVLETPLVISPNKVILESSLLAGVLAAVLSAGALGAMWGGADREPPGATAAGSVATGEPADEPAAPSGSQNETPEPPPPDAAPPNASPPGPVEPVQAAPPTPAPAPAPSPPSSSSRPIVPNAFVRPSTDPNRGVT